MDTHAHVENGEAEAVVSRLLSNHHPSWGLGTMSVSVYDTAWVGCITKTISGFTQWLFPTSFQCVLDAQSPDGMWPAHHGDKNWDHVEDTILSTMAALYCLRLHIHSPCQLIDRYGEGDLQFRFDLGSAALSRLLRDWKMSDCKAVGFEVLAPGLLALLEQGACHYVFPERENLLKVRGKKLAKIPVEVLYSQKPSTLLHSLEAFHGRVDFDFDRVAHHTSGGSMMASPSSTAAYLMGISTWDDEAEAYLRLVISNGAGLGAGSVPSAYPSTNFELTWVVSTLLEMDVWKPAKNNTVSQSVLTMLDASKTKDRGLIGFAPGIAPDMDDCAKASIIYSLLGRTGISVDIVEGFDSEQCLKTYDQERNPSLSANCNGLMALLLDNQTFSRRSATIEKVTHFICNTWLKASGAISDKWNLSPYYPLMLMAEALSKLLTMWDAGHLPDISLKLLKEEVLLVSFQCLVKTIQCQRQDGSWGVLGSYEETCYAILALISLQVLPLAIHLKPQIVQAIERGRSFLRSSTPPLEYLWIEKVTYRSENVTSAYACAAIHAPMDRTMLGPPARTLCRISTLGDFASVIDNASQLKGPRWLLLACWIESELYAPLIHSCDQSNKNSERPIFQRNNNATDFVAFNFVLANRLSDLNIAALDLSMMMSAALTTQNSKSASN